MCNASYHELCGSNDKPNASDIYEEAWQSSQVDPYADMFVILNYEVDRILRKLEGFPYND